jgi:hypothetical protein
VHVGDHGAKRELPFETEPEVDQDRKDREPEADRALGQQFRRHPRPDHLDPAVVHFVAQRFADLGDGGRLRLFAAGLLRDADEHVGRTAEFLQLHVAQSQSAQSRPHLRKIGRTALGLDLDQSTADEVDPEVEAVKEIERDREDRQQRRDREADAPEAHEIELGVVRNDPQQRDRMI